MKKLNVLCLIPENEKIKVGDLMDKIKKMSVCEEESFSLPPTRHSLDNILDWLQKQDYVKISHSKTRPPRKFVSLSKKGRKFLKNTIIKERRIFDQSKVNEQ